jgi:hypothetical protein
MIISSREGTTWLYYEDNEWKRELIGIGEPKTPGQREDSESPGSGDHWGTGCADAGKVGDDPFAYIATLDPFHGTTACVYTKIDRGLKGNKWKRHVLDVYGTPNQLKKTGDGPGHFILCADFDGDGDDEFLLSLFGPLDRDKNQESIPPPPGPHPNKGIMYYKAIDLDKGLFAKWKIAEESSARIAMGNFNGKGRIDLISMSYNVKRYYEEPQPVVTLHLNEFSPPKPVPAVAITSTVWANEGMVYLAYPQEITEPSSLPLIEVANYAIDIEIYPRGAQISIDAEEGVKVLYGSLTDSCGVVRKAVSAKVFPSSSSTTSKDTTLSADKGKGVILIRFRPVGKPDTWAKAEDVPVKTMFDASPFGLELPPLAFTKVESLWWGAKFRGVEFYNLSGFYFRFMDDKQQIAHMQFWTAGTSDVAV